MRDKLPLLKMPVLYLTWLLKSAPVCWIVRKALIVLLMVHVGEHVGDPKYPRDSPLFSENALTEYLKRCTPTYCRMGNPRRFLIQRKMYEKVRMTDKSVVHIEAAEDGTPHSWITIAAANVLPDVMFRISADMLSALKFDVRRAHMDRVEDPENSTPELPGFVTILRLYVATDLVRTHRSP